jgi:hypothetical protein
VAKQFTSIILVTDGEVGDYSVQACDRTLNAAFEANKFKISRAVCYVIGSYNEPNLSVTCPFTRRSESKVFSRTRESPLKTVMQYTQEDYKVLDSLEEISLENFEAKYTSIEQLIIAINMGRDGNPELHSQLVAMKTRLVKELSKKLGKKMNYSEKVRLMLQENRVEDALGMVTNMAEKYFEESGTGDLETKINYLISLCGDMRGQYSLGEIKSNKMKTAVVAVEGKLDQNVELEDLSKNPIECPIILDEDVPQILIDECEPFLLNVEKAIVDDINACPLRILNYPDLKAKFKARISTFTGVKYSDKMRKNPFTQNRLLGAIPLGTHKSHVRVGNNTIAKLVSGGKVMGNLNMYFAVVWILVNEDQIEFLKPIKANVTEHLLHRLTTSNTMASMCGLSQFVSTQVSTDIALWYCLNSGYLNQPAEKDTLRFHLFDIEHMLKLVQALGYPMHEGFTRHYLRTKALFYFLDKFKRASLHQKKAFKTLFRGLYQRGFFVETSQFTPKFKEVEVCSEFIPVDGPADEEQVKAVRKRLPAFCEGLTNEDLLYISTLLDEHKVFSDIFLDYSVAVPALPPAESNWKFGSEPIQHEVRIHPKTLRPISSINGQKWEDCAKGLFGVENKKELFQGCKYIEEFLLKHKKKPSRHELAVFYYNRYVEAGKRSTLPALTESWIAQLLQSYYPVFEECSIPEIVATIKESRTLEKRALLELNA